MRLTLWLLSLLIVLPVSTHAQMSVPRFDETDCNDSVLATALDATCGVLVVPEDRQTADARTIELAVVVLHAQTDTPAPDPLVILRGGPGGITIPVFETGFREAYAAFLSERDVIIFDQRGVAQLDCPDASILRYENAATPPDERLPNSEVKMILACHAALVAAGNQPQAYTSVQSATDVRDLTSTLGYEQINLFGISYGTRLGLTILRDHPQIVRSVIFDSVYPLEVALYDSVGRSQRRAFNLLFDTCEVDPNCSAAYPSFRANYYTALQTLNDNPVMLPLINPTNGKTYTIRIDGALASQAVYNMIYDGENIPLIPHAIEQIVNESDILPILPMIEDYLNQPTVISEGMYYSIQCGEEVPFETFFQAEVDGDARNRSFMTQVCMNWQRRQPAILENAAVHSDIPALVLSGAFDPITPPEWAQQVADNLSNSYNYVLPNVGHGVVRTDPCALQIAQGFLSAPDQTPDAGCIDAMQPIAFKLPG